MKKFIVRLVIFGVVLFGLLAGMCFFLPGTRARASMLAQQRVNEKRLAETPGRRIILIGGSGLSQGVVSSMIETNFNMRVVNTGLHAGLGLIYQMRSVQRYLHPGDVVVLAPEYSMFDSSTRYGDMELLSVLVDVVPEDRDLISFTHWIRLMQFVPRYGASKLMGLFKGAPAQLDRFNEYGDKEWKHSSPSYHQSFPIGCGSGADKFDPESLAPILGLAEKCRSMNVRVLLFPAALHRSSYLVSEKFIDKIATELAEHGIPYCAQPERYALPDVLYDGTPYHLNLIGRQLRSELLVEDLKELVNK